MDGKAIPQGSELTERSHRRRLSSILKAPRSPLKDLGSGNERCQEPAVEKRRKSSRRVSFAETIRVFTPELQSTGSADKENEGFGTSDSCNNIKGTANACGIAGMDTLLHGPIQAPGHNADWVYPDCAKDRTICFSSDNDMDMTTSNTVTIHGLIEEKTKKIDTSQFLASLKSQNSEELAKNKDFQLSTGDEHADFKKDSSMENKIKFSDFLASLESKKSKATNCLEDAEKENIFPFAPTHFHTQDNTGNITQMFREQDDGLDLTKCHTSNIDYFFPAFNRETTSQLISTSDSGNGQPKRLPLSEFIQVKSPVLNNNLNRPASNDQTVFVEDDMDITCSHTTRISQSNPAQLHKYPNETLLPSDKTINFAEDNEMELTGNHSVWLNRNPSATAVPRKESVFGMEHTTILPQGEDMDITKSHTVAIDGLSVVQVKPQAMSHLTVCNNITNDVDINGISLVGMKRLSSGPSFKSEKVPNKSLNYGPDFGHHQSSSGNLTTYASKLEYKPGDQVGPNKMMSSNTNQEPTEKMSTNNTKLDNGEKTVLFAYQQDDMELTKSHTVSIDNKLLQMSKKDTKSYFSGLKLTSVSDKTLLFSTDSDDMELTKSHTVCIDQKALIRDNKSISSGFQQMGSSVSTSGQVGEIERDFSNQRVKENTLQLNKVTGATSSKRKSIINASNHLSDDMEMTAVETDTFGKGPLSSSYEGDKTVVFTCDQQDMEITRSHTVSIDSKVSCERLQNNTLNSNPLDFNCTNTNIPKCKAQDGYTVANEQEGKLSKSLFGLPANCMEAACDMLSEKSSQEPCTTLQNKTIFFRAEQDDMDFTYSNTVTIKNAFFPESSKADKSVSCVPTLKSSVADKTVFEDDMELTKSHTMLIDERYLGLRNQSTSGKNITLATSGLDNVLTKPNTICSEKGTTKMSKQSPNETVYQEGDMEMTNVNAGLLIAAGKSRSWNQINPSFSDKTMYLCDQDDMDMTRAHTVAIENKVISEVGNNLKSVSQNNGSVSVNKSHLGDVKCISRPHRVHDFDEKHCTSRREFDQDIDITASNTVRIDIEKPGNDLQLPTSKSKVLSSTRNHHLDNMERDKSNDLVFDKENGNHLEKNTPVSYESQDKTLFLYEQNDMDITRSHTIAIKCKALEGMNAKNDSRVSQNTMKLTNGNAVLDLTNNTINMADITSTNRICYKDEDMDITKSNTVFIDHISDKLHNKSVRLSDVLPKRKSVSCRQKSLAFRDETILLVCNMEETNANMHLTESLINKSSIDKTVCIQGDMEMTKCHTVVIENKTLDAAHFTHPVGLSSQVSRNMTLCDPNNTDVSDEMDRTRPQTAANDTTQAESVPPFVLEQISYQDLSMPPGPKDATVTLSVTETEIELKLQGKSVSTEGYKDLNGDDVMFPNEDQSMDITKAHTAAVEVNFLSNNSHIPSTSVDFIKYDTEPVNRGKLIETEQKCDDLNDPIEKLDKYKRKSYASSLSRSSKSGILEQLGNKELTQIHTIPVDDVAFLKMDTGPCNAETDFILDKESDNIGAGFIDLKSKESEHTSFRNCISPNRDPNLNPSFPNNSGVGSDCKIENFEENNIPDKSIHENGFTSHLLGINSESLTIGERRSVSNTLNCASSGLTSDSGDNMRPEEQKACVLPVETCAQQERTEVSQEKDVKKAKLRGKRVSFHFPEIDIVAKDVILDQVTELFKSQREKDDQVEPQDRTVQVTDQISDFKMDLINQAPVIKNTENLEENLLHKDPELSKLNVSFPEDISSKVEGFGTSAELSQKSRNNRRSIADIQLKIKSLTQKSKISPHHTAPVSSAIDSLYPSGSEQVLLNADLPNTATVQEKEPNNEKNKTTMRENCLPNRLSVKVFQPKLPKKRVSSTSNVLEPVLSSVSEAQPQSYQSSKALLKTLSVIDDGQCIDEEMLPACPDDQDLNSIFHYEVPEGAWEELCEEEALQQNLNVSASQPKDSMNGQKRVRDTEEDFDSQREKRARWNEDILEKDEAQASMAFRSSDKSYRSDCSTHASKTMEQTYYSSSSQDSRGEGMSVELNSQQYSQMDSRLPWDSGCEQSLWQKFQDGTITVQEFFVLLKIRILIQKPRYSELPSKRGMNEDLTASEILLDQYVYQPKLQVYEEECNTLYQTIEELKGSTELQHKPLIQINSLLWEAMRMCSENELMYFGMTLKNMKSLYSKKSKRIAHEEKVSTYTKLLNTAQTQWEQLQARLNETDKLLREIDDCISSLEIETSKLNDADGCVQIQEEVDCLKVQEQHSIRECLELEERKQKVLGQLGCLQEEARDIDRRLQEPSFTEWELVKWTDKEAAFIFLYGSLELSISFGDYIDGESFNNQPCRKISSVTVESQLNDMFAPPSSILVHRLILQYVEKKGAFHETYKMQNNLPQLLSDLSLVVSRCRLLGEELEYLIKWGAKYNIVKVQVQSQEVRLLFSSLAALVKFELIIHLSDTYPTVPLAFTVNNHIGRMLNNKVTAVMSKVPLGLWYLRRTVKSIHENLLV